MIIREEFEMLRKFFALYLFVFVCNVTAVYDSGFRPSGKYNDFHSTTLSAGYCDAGTLCGNCLTSGIQEHTTVQMTDKAHRPG